MTIEEDASGIRIQAGKELHILIDKVQLLVVELEDARDRVFAIRTLVESDDGTIFQLPKDLNHINLRINQFHMLMQQFTNTLT